MPAPDPWTAFLTWLTTVIVPNWTELVSMLPFFLVLGVVGPILSLIMLAWVWHFFKRRRAHIHLAIPEAFPAPRDARGEPRFPPNVPFCLEHALIYPASRVTCEIDGANLSVRCPVDGTARASSLQICSACGTRYVLGASKAPALIERRGRPPEGGAAVA